MSQFDQQQIMIDGLTLQVKTLDSLLQNLVANNSAHVSNASTSETIENSSPIDSVSHLEQISKLNLQLLHLSAAYDRQAELIKQLQK
ncbi:hypothetical protein BB561_003416 [Smittium simulii]|uniref:Uncharacterized protein n=1 Tax=Smittium simulii TaxID=133385 RepID=A0A2T9YLL5_9FUNG|nr:hypothetical protein BB561_003416 [Smittium simulii]